MLKNKKIFKVISGGFFAGLLFFSSVSLAAAATMSLSPVSKSAPVGETFDVLLNIDTQGEKATSADAVLKFDGSILEVTQVTEGGSGADPFFPELFKNITPNEVYVGAAVRDPSDFREGQGTLATLKLKGKKEGITDFKFDCTPGKTSDSNVSKSDKNATDILDCTATVNGRYTVGAGTSTVTPTPAATSAPNVTATPAPTRTPTPTLPVSGNAGATIGLVAMGVALTVIGLISKIVLGI